MLKLNKVNKCYSNGTKELHVLKNISLEAEKGSFISVIGLSGAGKSTLLHVAGGLECPNSGSVTINGKLIYNMKDLHLSKMRNSMFGFVFQFYHLLQEFTVIENVMMPGLIYKKEKKKDLLEKSLNLLDTLEIAGRKNHYPNQLSGGEQQRVAIARALIAEPEILLCDEPTGNLDSKTSEKICSLLINLHNVSKQTIILVTHQENIAKKAEKIYYMEDGRLSCV